MSERKARSSRTSRAIANGVPPDRPEPQTTVGSTTIAEGGAAAQPAEVKEAAHPGVAVFRVPVEDSPGSEEIRVMPVNGLDLLAVPTLLRKAAAIQEQQLGL